MKNLDFEWLTDEFMHSYHAIAIPGSSSSQRVTIASVHPI